MEKEFRLEKVVPSGTITVFFHVGAEKVNIITLGSWRGSGHSAFTETVEKARESWKELLAEGFKKVEVS